MTAGRRRLRVPALLLAALAALLALTATASAETRAGESTSVLTEGTPSPEATIVKASASYETSGNVTFNVTTAGAPSRPKSEGEMYAAMVTSQDCGQTSGETFFAEILLATPPPLAVIASEMATAGAIGRTGELFKGASMPATKSVVGTTTTLTASSSEIANREFNCALIGAGDAQELRLEEEGVGDSFIGIPLIAQAEPPPPPSGSSSASASQAPPAPAAAAPAPPVLSIAKLKPVTLKTGKWQTVKVKVTNTGAGASAAGSLRLKGPKGVVARPERQQLPVLAPGRGFTLTFRVQLTAKAKKKSTVALSATASGVTTSGSLVVKLKE